MTELSMHNQIILGRLTDDEDWILKGLRQVPGLGLRFDGNSEFWDELVTLSHHGFINLYGGNPDLTEMGAEVADFMIERDST